MAETGKVADNREAEQFELDVDGQTAVLQYKRENQVLALLHTEVPDGLRGRGIGQQLVVAALAAAHDEKLGVVAICPFVRAYLKKHPQN
jgi:predicted GNAT family acetyltransferase